MIRAIRLPILVTAFFLGAFPAARAMDQILLGSAAANAGTTGVAIDISVTHDAPIHAFSVALLFDSEYLTLGQITDEGTATASLNAEFFYPTIDNAEGHAVLGVIFSYYDDPYAPVSALEASPDSPQRVAVLSFDVAPDAPPGEYRITLADRIGSPPISNSFSTAGTTTRPSLLDGTLTVNNENLLLLDTVKTQPGTRFEVKVAGKHPSTLQGYSIAFTYDTSVLTFVEATYYGTEVQQLLSPQIIELFESKVDLEFGPPLARVMIGAQLDFVPPFTGHEVPASPDHFQVLARFIFDGKDDPALIGTETPLVFHNAGVTSLNNSFVINSESFSPALIDGKVLFVDAPLFKRGFINTDDRLDISDGIVLLQHLFVGEPPPPCQNSADLNDDNRLDISDPIYLFSYMFTGGDPPKEPYAFCGPDPTPGQLPCPGSAQCP